VFETKAVTKASQSLTGLELELELEWGYLTTLYSCDDCQRRSHRSTHGATENAGVENAIRAKLQWWKMQDWKMREQIAGIENAGVSRMERQPEIILRQS